MDVNTCFATTDGYRTLALYSHLIPALATVVLGLFAYTRAQNRHKAAAFFIFTIGFALWLAGDVIIWTSNSYDLIAALWEPLDLVAALMYLLLFVFLYDDLLPGISRRYLNLLVLAASVAPFFITLSGHAVTGLNQPQCEMFNQRFIEDYLLVLECVILGAVFLLGAYRVLARGTARQERIRVAMTVLSVVLFMGIFSGSDYISSYTGIYEINLYALFVLPLFILFLTISITSFGTFRLGDSTVKALFYVFVILAGTQFFNVQTVTDFALSAMSFTVVCVLGIMLFRSNEREIAARHKIEEQEQELEVANKQQENLLHFISHEIKGYLTKGEAAFAEIVEDTTSPIPAPVKTLAESALGEMRKGVATVMDILDASNLKKGTVAFKKAPLDLRTVVEAVVGQQRKAAEEKGLRLEVMIADGKYGMTGDEEKLREHVVRNLIDNAIKYTPKGVVHVELSGGDGKIRFAVQDSGVGITPEDMKHLFTEGGHGKDSIKVNVHSTGYGLFIAKQIVDAHGGKIRAESAGAGLGSRFIVELPATV